LFCVTRLGKIKYKIMAEENQKPVARLDQQLAQVKNVKDLFAIPDVKQRFIKNFEAVTGRKDGENRLEQEKFAYMEILNEKPELKAAPMFSHFSSLVKAGTTGLSFRDNKLYVQPVKNREGEVVALKVTSSPAGKREQFEMMPNVKEAPEAQVVMKGDIFIYDKLNQRIIKHETTEKTSTEMKLDNILYSYQRIVYKDGSVKDVVVPHDDLVQAKKKSKIKSADAGLWIEFPGEACKKTATNRAFRLYHKYPDNVILYDHEAEEDNTVDGSHEIEIPENQIPQNVDQDSGEVYEAEQEPAQKEEPKVEKKKTVAPKQGELL